MRDALFLTFSCSPGPYRSVGVSYSPNPDREPPQKWAQSWEKVNFWPYFSVIGLWTFTNPRGTDFFWHILVATDHTVPTVYHTPLTQTGNPPQNGPKVGPVVKFLAQNLSKCLKKLQTAISRPFLVQMS